MGTGVHAAGASDVTPLELAERLEQIEQERLDWQADFERRAAELAEKRAALREREIKASERERTARLSVRRAKARIARLERHEQEAIATLRERSEASDRRLEEIEQERLADREAIAALRAHLAGERARIRERLIAIAEPETESAAPSNHLDRDLERRAALAVFEGSVARDGRRGRAATDRAALREREVQLAERERAVALREHEASARVRELEAQLEHMESSTLAELHERRDAIARRLEEVEAERLVEQEKLKARRAHLAKQRAVVRELTLEAQKRLQRADAREAALERRCDELRLYVARLADREYELGLDGVWLIERLAELRRLELLLSPARG